MNSRNGLINGRCRYSLCTVHRISKLNQVSRSTGNPVYLIAGYLLGQFNEMCDLDIIVDNKLNFNGHKLLSHIAHIAHVGLRVRASLIVRTFVSEDPKILTKAFMTYVRPLLEYSGPG